MSIRYKSLDIQAQFKLVLTLFLVLSLLEAINLVSGRLLNQYGNTPRLLSALPGIYIGPWLHGNLAHFLSNIVPMSIFSFLLLQYGSRKYLLITFWLISATGILVWLFARSATHIGLSGLIYGYFGYLLLAGFITAKPRLMLISVLVGFFYGGLIFGILPSRPYVSWESHLFGFVCGLIAAKWWAK